MKIWNVISGVASTLFVASILTFGLSTEIASAHKGGDHDDCAGPHKNDPGCTPVSTGEISIASVGKWHGRAARDYAILIDATYTEISSNGFGKKLAKAKANADFLKLCTDYRVLIFEWDSPNIKNLEWGDLESYMACGGHIIWEDTTNIVKLHNSLTVTIINHDGSAPSPIEVDFWGSCATDTPSLCNSSVNDFDPIPPIRPPDPSSDTSFFLVNSHIEFTTILPFGLNPYLIQASESQVIGVYGDFTSNGGGCIVMTGPDNNFHGDETFAVENEELFTLRDAHRNMHALLFHQLDWLLDDDPTGCSPAP